MAVAVPPLFALSSERDGCKGDVLIKAVSCTAVLPLLQKEREEKHLFPSLISPGGIPTTLTINLALLQGMTGFRRPLQTDIYLFLTRLGGYISVFRNIHLCSCVFLEAADTMLMKDVQHGKHDPRTNHLKRLLSLNCQQNYSIIVEIC